MQVGPSLGSPQEGTLHVETSGKDLLVWMDEVRTTEPAYLHAVIGADRALLGIDVKPTAEWPSRLLGASVGRGFRSRAGEITPGDEGKGSLIAQFLDDLPTAVTIVGYADLRRAGDTGAGLPVSMRDRVLHQLADTCSDWRADGSAIRSVRAGTGIPVSQGPILPPQTVAGPYDGISLAPQRAGSMRRLRRIDATPGETHTRVEAAFQDTLVESDDTERVLHEYTVALAVANRDGASPSRWRIMTVSATPGVLPFLECPAAAASVTELVGAVLEDLPAQMPLQLVGVTSCTHLNDLLRSVGRAGPALLGPPGHLHHMEGGPE